ncbi:flavin reductase family protein [Pseudodesulfovibrio cashew]|uniref:Flavin reductase family protein n=1 Tax=Pseudodesulfovibrio cashew TaxID=2678688 RepID=A0A6I6JC30_9BACT|nr:flavin reductase family protein [Pseudodesulfovibrio cashew]QGY39661.1 flavin reductase family protein [Pseudodesulfovibrio cashew]
MKKSLGAKTLAQPTPVWAVGAFDEDGKPNAMIAAWGGIASSQPPAMTVSVRPSRHTYAGIMKHKAFTISICNEAMAAEADYLGMASGKNEDKLARAGLTAVKSDVVNAPYIDEFPLVIECTLLETHEVGVHTMLIGEIKDVKCDEDKLIDGKHPDVEKILPLIFSPGARDYHTVGRRVGKGFDIGRKYLKD